MGNGIGFRTGANGTGLKPSSGGVARGLTVMAFDSKLLENTGLIRPVSPVVPGNGRLQGCGIRARPGQKQRCVAWTSITRNYPRKLGDRGAGAGHTSIAFRGGGMIMAPCPFAYSTVSSSTMTLINRDMMITAALLQY